MLATASIIGRNHRLRQQNCHDFATSQTLPDGTSIAIVLDGCGSKYKDATGAHQSQNEVGAKLLGEFALQFLVKQLAQNHDIMMAIDHLYDASLSFLTSLLDLVAFDDESTQKRFIYTNLLCTMVGFVRLKDTAVFFWRGDGWLIHNDTITNLNANNHPDYLAYDLLSEPKRWQTKTITATEINRLAVATDGWSESLLSKLSTPQNNILLQRWVNVQSKQTPHFEDDASIAIYWNSSSHSQPAQSRGDEEQGSGGENSPHLPSPSSPAPSP